MNKKINILLMLILIISLASCSNNKKIDNAPMIEEKSKIKNLTGIKIGSGQLNEKNEFVHNIFNFDNTKKKVRITTLCYNLNGDIIDNTDTYIMELAPKSVSGWSPKCPDGTVKYSINIKEID